MGESGAAIIRQCVILAGGNGTRLKPLWDGPKTLVPVKGKPFALYQLEWLARQGVWEVVYCAGPHGNLIYRALGDARYGMRLRYVHDADGSGTAGALRAAYDAGVLAPEFFVLYGDSYLRIDAQRVAAGLRREIDKRAVMTVLANDNLIGVSNVSMNADLVSSYEDHPDDRFPQRYIDAGLWAMRRMALEHGAGAIGGELGHHSLAEWLRGYIANRWVIAHETHERFYEVGTPQGVAELESFLDLQ